ncbi:MAG: hypothetical protein HW416_951 [Chloroflexi bacterium]|nr:hypothetical protein [Chloroflexota bacterium]
MDGMTTTDAGVRAEWIDYESRGATIRGTQLSTGWVEVDELRCFYHGWKYDSSGQCIEQPAEPEPFCQRIKIRGYPVEEYVGLIFAFLGEGEPPPFPRYPEFDGDGIVHATASHTPPATTSIERISFPTSSIRPSPIGS